MDESGGYYALFFVVFLYFSTNLIFSLTMTAKYYIIYGIEQKEQFWWCK